MTDDGWGKSWPTEKTVELIKNKIDRTWPSPPNPITEPEAFVASVENRFNELTNALNTSKQKEYNNKVPTHDPYTNPNAHLYHECTCGAILDPGTKSFAALNNAASDAGWKIRWKQNGDGYQAFCVKCGEDVE